jgi:DNA-binding XRE family transcriptional regulator
MYQYKKLFLFSYQILSLEVPMEAGNTVKKIREAQLLSKAELARKAGVSPLTIDRIEKGKDCRMETKRKIILALGYKLSDKDKIFTHEQ